MFYFEAGRYGVPLFWRESGLPVFLGSRRLSKRILVWWMPTNWIAIAFLTLMAPVSLGVDAWAGRGLFRRRPSQTKEAKD